MAANPGSLAGQIPPSGDGVVRRQSDEKRDAGQQYAVLARQVGTLQTLIDDLADTVASIPIVVAGGASASAFGLAAGYATYATVNLTVPTGKTSVTIMATGNAAALDTTSGGITSVNGRIIIAASTGPAIPSSKDAGASAVNNIITPVHNFTGPVTPGSTIVVRLQISPLNPSAFPASPSNIASLAVMASFSS